MPRYECGHCGVTMLYRKKKGQKVKQWIKSICGNSNDKDVHLMLVKGGKRVKNNSSRNKR